MPLETQALVVFDLFIAALLSMLIGIDRERGNHPAGVRTHMLVGVGSCLFTLLSLYAFPGGDEARIASNIVVGIGFLGAGTIVKKEEETNVKNLTTAASIWSTAAVGMAVGAGAWLLAFAAVSLIWFILAIVQRMEIAGTKKDKSHKPQGTADSA